MENDAARLRERTGAGMMDAGVNGAAVTSGVVGDWSPSVYDEQWP